MSVKSSLVTPRLIDSARKRDREVHVWTVNDHRRMGFFIDLGVSNIITDDPDVLVAMLNARAALSDVERLLLKFTTWLERKGLKATSWKVFEDWLKSWLPIKGRNL